MQNLVQMIMKNWGVRTVLSVTNRQGLLLSLSAGVALLLTGCGGGGGGSGDEGAKTTPTMFDFMTAEGYLEEGAGTIKIKLLDNTFNIDGFGITISDTKVNGTGTATAHIDTGELSKGVYFEYTLNPGFEGDDGNNARDDYFYYYTSGTITHVGTVSIYVTAVNDPPKLETISYVTFDEDTSKTITLTATDVDDDDSALTYSVTGGKKIIAHVVGDGDDDNVDDEGDPLTQYVKISAVEDYYGAETLKVTVSDGEGGMDQQEFTITVNPVNDAPGLDDPHMFIDDGVAKKVEVSEGGSETIYNTTLIDVDGDYQEWTYTFSESENIEAAFDKENLSYTITDKGVQIGSTGTYEEIITLTVDDGQDENNSSVTYKILVELQFSNDPLTLEYSFETGVDSLSFYEGSELTITLASTDDEGDTLQYTVLGGDGIRVNKEETTETSLTFTSSGTALGSSGSIQEDFYIVISDGISSTLEPISVTMNFLDVAPVLPTGLDTITFDEDDVTADGHFALIDLMDYGLPTQDSDGDEITYSSATTVGAIAVEIADGSNLKITPDENFNGPADIEITAKDPQDKSATTMLSIEVTPVNDAPVFQVIGDQVTNEDTAFELTISAPDPDHDPVSYTATVDDNASASVDEDGSLTVTPIENFSGDIMVTLTVSDDHWDVVKEFTLEVVAVDDPPTQMVNTINTDNYFDYSRMMYSFSCNRWEDSILSLNQLSLYKLSGDNDELIWGVPTGVIGSQWWARFNSYDHSNFVDKNGYLAGDYQLNYSGESPFTIYFYTATPGRREDYPETSVDKNAFLLFYVGFYNYGGDDVSDTEYDFTLDYEAVTTMNLLISDLFSDDDGNLVPDFKTDSTTEYDIHAHHGTVKYTDGMITYFPPDAQIKTLDVEDGETYIDDKIYITIADQQYELDIVDASNLIFKYYPVQLMHYPSDYNEVDYSILLSELISGYNSSVHSVIETSAPASYLALTMDADGLGFEITNNNQEAMKETFVDRDESERITDHKVTITISSDGGKTELPYSLDWASGFNYYPDIRVAEINLDNMNDYLTVTYDDSGYHVLGFDLDLLHDYEGDVISYNSLNLYSDSSKTEASTIAEFDDSHILVSQWQAVLDVNDWQAITDAGNLYASFNLSDNFELRSGSDSVERDFVITLDALGIDIGT